MPFVEYLEVLDIHGDGFECAAVVRKQLLCLFKERRSVVDARERIQLFELAEYLSIVEVFG